MLTIVLQVCKDNLYAVILRNMLACPVQAPTVTLYNPLRLDVFAFDAELLKVMIGDS